MKKESKKEFTFLGMNMQKISVNYGGFLVTWGIAVSVLSESQSITSFIPTILGIPICFLGLLSKWQPKRQKLFMHIVVAFGLICFIGGLDFLSALLENSNPFENIYAGTSKLMLLATGFVFCLLCIQSFRYMRALKSLK